ncbi:hypothetical protein JTE90_025368 [Oedothorax gibbosus]|uniref:Hexosyltransferase n=1 Tax=Oedothorax gibbosus TaxID=931172 RepID=A0AAV6TS01_9ARAC|nr:hypothetical protein JTE90_025368 [Oedothorax gibbosus]
MIEKWVTTCSKLESKLHGDRKNIALVPIITRKKLRTEYYAQIWGLVGIGPHHPKMDSDRVPLLIMEFVVEDNPKKYQKWTYFSLHDRVNKREFKCVGRVYSVHYMF